MLFEKGSFPDVIADFSTALRTKLGLLITEGIQLVKSFDKRANNNNNKRANLA